MNVCADCVTAAVRRVLEQVLVQHGSRRTAAKLLHTHTHTHGRTVRTEPRAAKSASPTGGGITNGRTNQFIRGRGL